jgi:transcriptional regulator GlxA family with amidase domain
MERRTFLTTAGITGATALAAGTVLTHASSALAGPRSADHPLRVQIVMFDGVEEQDFAGPYEVFSLAGALSSGAITTTYVTTGRPGTVVAAFGTAVKVTQGWSPHSADVIIVPGGGFNRRNSPGVWQEIERGTLPSALAKAPRRGLTIASLCTGAILLAVAGLTDGRPCTTHRRARDELASRGAEVVNARVVDDGDLVTSAGVTSGLDLSLHLVNREIGPDIAVLAEEILEYEARGTIWKSGSP